MKKIQCLKDFKKVECILSNHFVEYLKSEFYGLYDYLNNGDKLESFSLPNYQNMVILEEDEEINIILNSTLNIEFVEEVELTQLVIYRIGINIDEDVQLYFAIKDKCNLNV
ncbi:hypothetical protein DFO70_104397 [Cytobacillus firmus]|uniref:Uncharacterized protein n=2 Tax=Cytobacillus TaxID=2675230 RepID=A0A366JZ78_CYTFI|nr:MULTISPECIES: hypothetical protein [Cytobacillus]RBP94754.1 hypothetical protein DFO70_104397 [Cytobacillus firmus]TDX43499.1 hypothetical protein DFO72_105398 [Cytobacillus oceanisediminis]